MVNTEGSSADLLIHLEFCVKMWSSCQYYEDDERTLVTKHKYSKSFYRTQLHYDVFFRVHDAYDTISRTLDGLGVESDDQVECINATISKAQQLCVNNMRKGDHRENNIMCNLEISYDGIFVDNKRQVVQQSMEKDDEDEGMVPAQQSMEEDDEDEGMVPAALPAIRSLGASRIKVEEGKKAHQCMVCQEEYCNGEIVTCMPCLHMFHRDCITKWLVKSHLCPVCRFEMPKYS